MNKPITIQDLRDMCNYEINKGNGKKVIMISDDDEGNGFHYLWYAFCDVEDAGADDYVIEDIAKQEDTIVLG